MKPDLERTKEFLDSLGILYGEELVEKAIVFGSHEFSDDIFPECNKVDGYNGFYTQFNFDKSGKFLTVGAWE